MCCMNGAGASPYACLVISMLVGLARGRAGPQASGVARGQTSGRERADAALRIHQARRMASPGVGPAEASAKDGFEST
jgi:hypothetical protein